MKAVSKDSTPLAGCASAIHIGWDVILYEDVRAWLVGSTLLQDACHAGRESQLSGCIDSFPRELSRHCPQNKQDSYIAKPSIVRQSSRELASGPN